MEEANLIDMSTDNTDLETEQVKTEKFCTEWSCVRKVVRFITLEGENVKMVDVGDKKLIDEVPVVSPDL